MDKTHAKTQTACSFHRFGAFCYADERVYSPIVADLVGAVLWYLGHGDQMGAGVSCPRKMVRQTALYHGCDYPNGKHYRHVQPVANIPLVAHVCVFARVVCRQWAHFVGRKLGKRKLAPNVSPNKSIEGLVGGIITASLVAIGVGIGLDLTGVALVAFLSLSGLTVMASVLGDLFESMLKRRAGIKDSGTILPGHGGVLDRIDSLLSATPVFALGVAVLVYLDVLPALGDLPRVFQ